jgi:hypothetical protein
MTLWPSFAYCNRDHYGLRRTIPTAEKEFGRVTKLAHEPWIGHLASLGVLHQKRHQKHAEDLGIEVQGNSLERALTSAQ